MIFSLIGARENKLKYRELNKLRELCDFVSSQEMINYLQGSRFASYFKIYAEIWIYSQQKLIQDLDTSREREVNFEIVEQRMIIEERLGSDKFFTDLSDKRLWDREDHLAFALFQICRVNIKSAAELFFNKGLSSA